MQSIELTAKTAEEAKTIAAEKLGVSPDQIEINVLETVRGLFGKSTLRVKATTIETAPEAPAKAAKPAAKVAPAKAEKPSRAKAKPAAEPEPEPVAEVAPEPEAKPAKAKPERRGREPKAEVAVAEGEPAAEEAVASQEDAEALLAHLHGWLAAGDLEVSARVKEVAGKYVTLEIDGKDLGHLVGKHGEVLNALQYLMNISAGRRLGNGVRCTLDGDDYRTRREEKLTALATKIANQVKERGEEAVLDALPAFERRIVHKALSVLEGVTTYSEGEEPNRRVVIAPLD